MSSNSDYKNDRGWCALARTTRVVVLFTVALMLSGSVLAQGANDEGLPVTTGQYELGPADVIRITVLKQALLTQDSVRIGNDGKIRLPMLSEPIQAACLTEAQLADVITEKYRKYILDPQVNVSVREFNSNTVAVIGAVNSPGRFQLQRSVRLLEILALANGPSASASKEIQILRTSVSQDCDERGSPLNTHELNAGAEPEIISLKIDDVLSGSESANLTVRGGDIIRVTQAELKQAYVLGNVGRGVVVDVKDPVTLTTALAMAGGTLSGSKLEKIKITRRTPGSLSKTDIIVNFKEIRGGLRDDVLLEPNDIVEVPGPSGTMKFLKDIIRVAVPAITRVPIVIP